jgi:CRP/FNR family cyclic AMP-dependent transcriptional regulator
MASFAKNPAASTPLAAQPSALARLAERGTRRRYRKGTLLIQEDERGDTLFILAAGRVKVFSTDAEGRELTYAVLGPGDFFGEMSLDGGPRSASAITTEECDCAVVTLATLRQYLSESPEFAFELLATVIRRAREATAVARGLALDGAYGRLASYLNSAAGGDAGHRAVPERLTHRELASRIGCSREMVSRLLKDLQVGGYVEARDRRIVLKRALPARW